MDFTTAFPPVRSKEEEDRSKSRSLPGSALNSSWLDILLNSIWLTLPMVLLTAALVIYMLVYQVQSNTQGSELLTQNVTTPSDNAFYVDADATMLVFLASWMSSVAPLLTGSAIALATYPVARQLLNDTEQDDRLHCRPTPFEFHIMLKIIGGSTWGGLWALVLYVFGWKQHMNRQSAALTSLVLVMAITMVLSILVLGADTWLHIATTTVSLTRIIPLATNRAPYSFSLAPECTTTNNSLAAIQEAGVSCVMNATSFLPVFEDPTAAIETVNNRSTSRSVLQMPSDGLSYLSPVYDTIDSSYDFVASTYAVSTQCKPISQACNLVNTGNVTFDCADGAFYSEGYDMGYLSLMIQVFKTYDMSDVDDPNQYYGVPNPFYVAAATTNLVPADSPLRDDPEVVAPRYAVSAIMLCNVTVLDLEYASRGGRSHTIKTESSNASVTNMFAGGMAATTFGYDNMRAAMNMAALLAGNAQDLADRFAVTLSDTVVAIGAGSVQQSPVALAQERKPILVARVPKPPFFFLTCINIGYVLLGILLASLATVTSHEARQVQYRLTTAGVVAELLDREHARNDATTIEELYGEYHGSERSLRVGVDRTSKGGFTFSAVPFPSENDNYVYRRHAEMDRELFTSDMSTKPSWLSRWRRAPSLKPIEEVPPGFI